MLENILLFSLVLFPSSDTVPINHPVNISGCSTVTLSKDYCREPPNNAVSPYTFVAA